MSEIITADVGGNYTLPPAGNQVATCIGLYVIGTQKESYQGHEKKVKKIILAFELVDTNHVFREENGPEPFIMVKEFTHNLGSSANLRKFMNAWSKVKFTDEIAKKFNLADLVGSSCLANVVHDKNKSEKDFATIISATPLPANTAVTPARMPKMIFNINKEPFDVESFKKLPEWIQKKVQASDEYQKLSNVAPSADAMPQQANPFAQQPQTVTKEAAKKMF